MLGGATQGKDDIGEIYVHYSGAILYPSLIEVFWSMNQVWQNFKKLSRRGIDNTLAWQKHAIIAYTF